MKKFLFLASLIATSSNLAIAQEESVEQITEEVMLNEEIDSNEQRRPRGEGRRGDRKERNNMRMGGEDNQMFRGNRRNNQPDSVEGSEFNESGDYRRERKGGQKKSDFMKSLPENIRQRIEKRREVMKNLSEDQKKAVKAERERHREAIKKITGVDIFE